MKNHNKVSKKATPPAQEIVTLRWQEVGAMIHQSSYNGVRAFIHDNEIEPIRLRKRVLYDRNDIYAALHRNKVGSQNI